MAGAGQVGAALALWIRLRRDRKNLNDQGALPVGILGIGEPLIYGVTLPLGRPFITGMYRKTESVGRLSAHCRISALPAIGSLE